MGISTTTRKRLWQRSGNRCAKCRSELHEDATEFDDPSILGEEAHIVGDKKTSARYDDPLPLDERDEYHNLIILCNRCHKIVDDQKDTYTVEILRRLKAHHEKWVRDTLDPGDRAKERDDLQFASIVDGWGRLADLDRWEVWGSYVLGGGGQPGIVKEQYDRLFELKNWLFSRVWPHRYPPLRAAFENFRRVLEDFLNTFIEHAEEVGAGGSLLRTAKFYRKGGFIRNNRTGWNDYALSPAFDHHVELVRDLFVELTRAANYICDRVRETISPTFRVREGLLVVCFGPTETGSIQSLRPQYRGDERVEKPYPGLDAFCTARTGRDIHFDEGPPPASPAVRPDLDNPEDEEKGTPATQKEAQADESGRGQA